MSGDDEDNDEDDGDDDFDGDDDVFFLSLFQQTCSVGVLAPASAV